MTTYFVLGPAPSNIRTVVSSLMKSGGVYDEKFKTEAPTVDKAIIDIIVPEDDKWPLPTLQRLIETLSGSTPKAYVVVGNWQAMCAKYLELDQSLTPVTASEMLQEAYRKIFEALTTTGIEYELIADNIYSALPLTDPKPRAKLAIADAAKKSIGRKLVLVSHLAPGDTVVMTAAVRDLHKAYPDRFITDVSTTADQIWENNPYVTKLRWHKEKREVIDDDQKLVKKDVVVPDEDGVTVINMHYSKDYAASVSRSNSNAYHFIHGYTQHLESILGLRIPVTEFKGDIHLSKQERAWVSQIEETGEKRPFWIMMAGGKFDFTTKWWPTENYQAVVDHFRDRVLFVQCGEAKHWHPRLDGAIDLLGKTDTRQFIRLMYHASGVVCPITMAMHLAAAVEVKKGRPKRPCVVIAGGRESPQWEAYPQHKFLHTMGSLPCCESKGCWVSRAHKVGDGDKKDEPENLCQRPVSVGDYDFAECMTLITPHDVIRQIELYLHLEKAKNDRRVEVG